MTGFDNTVDPSAGYPTGYVYLTTTCSTGGKGGGGHFTVADWTSDTWDLTGALLSYSVATPNPNPPSPLSTTDPLTGNQIYDSASPCPGLGGTGSTAYACLEWASGFAPRPTVTGISPGIGPATGGTSVTISGDGFAAATAVDFGSASAAFTINSDTSITAISPTDTSGTSPDTLPVTVASPGGTSFTSSSDQFTSYVQPTITGVSPNSGPVTGGYYVTVTGTNFIGTTSVNVGDVVTAFSVVDDNTLSVYIPGSDSGPGDSTSISVTSPGGTSPSAPADQFTYTAVVSPLAPTVNKVSPNYGPPGGGTAVTITGTNFTGATAVDFGTTAVSTFKVVSDSSITTTAPAGTAFQDVTVTNSYGQSLTSTADLFNYGPIVTAVTPNAGSAGGGTAVTIKGHGFLGATEVDFGGQSVTFTVNTYGTAITAKSAPTPGSGVQVVDVTVVGPNGTSQIVPTDTFTYAAPLLTSITPSSGSAGGNTKVVIKGKYLYDPGNVSVTFGGVQATSVSVNSTGTAITASTPQEPTTGVVSANVSVSTTAGTTTLPAAFTYAAPTLTSLSPSSGSPAGGTTVKLVGLNLYGATAVNFGSSLATITSETQTSIAVKTPPGTGAVTVTVTTFAGTSGALTYTY